ncbi:hypothetical protein MMC27_008649 [Xylographa pallens]|nr:hypothetical protein [Xylographa pallens]
MPNARQSAPYNGEYVGTIEVVVLRCNPVIPSTPLAEVEEVESMQTVPWSEIKLHSEESRVQRLPGNHTKSDEGLARLSSIVNRAEADEGDKTDPGRTARPSFGYDGQWDESDTGDLHKANHWGFEMTGSNTGVYRPTQNVRPTQAQQGKRWKANKGPKAKLSRGNRSKVNDVNNKAHESADQAIQATPPAVVIDIAQAPPQAKHQKRHAGNTVSRSENSSNSRRTACHSIKIENEVSASDASERGRRGLFDTVGSESWGNGQHGNPTSRTISLKGEPQSWKYPYSEKKDSNSTSNWVDSINEERKHEAYSDGYGGAKSAEVMHCTELNKHKYCTEGKGHDATKTENEKLRRSEDDHGQSRRDYKTNTNEGRKRNKEWSKSSQSFDFEGECATHQPWQEEFQRSAKCGSDSVSWQLPKDKIASGRFDSCRSVMVDTQSVGQQDATEPPRSVPGGWPRNSPASPPHYRQDMHNDDPCPTNRISRQAENVTASTIRDSATLIPSPVQHYWGSSRLASNPEVVDIDDALVPGIVATERTSRLPDINGSRFHNDRSYPQLKENTSSLRLSGRERPGFDPRIGQSLLYAIPEAILWRENVSHQVQSGQPVAYSHKVATPKYMDSHESPYAVFVFQCRSRPVIEQLLGITVEEPVEQEKERPKDLTKARIIEHYVREKSSRTPSRATGRNIATDSRIESHGGLSIDINSVSDKLSRSKVQNRTESIAASPTADKWRIEHENSSSGKNDVPAGRKPSWEGWAGESKKNRELNSDNLNHRDTARISWPVEECELGRRPNAKNTGTSRGGLGHSDKYWTWKTGELEDPNTDANAARVTDNEAGQGRLSKSRERRSKNRATVVQSNNHWDHTSRRGSVDRNATPWGEDTEQNKSGDVRNWGHQNRNSPVIAQGRGRGQRQETIAENVEW